ncbi:MAG TPA: hypothetical protein VKI17_06650 [Gemmataceae bacterium]|nr:hypothetical protein [Gemmataceae bacterium]
MLARLNGIDGVESSSASVGNPEGALVRVSLRAGADRAKIAAEVQRVLSEAVKDRSPVPLTSPAAAAVLQQKEWLDPEQLADLAATDLRTSEGRAPVLLVALFLGAMVVVLGLFGWRHLRRRQAGSSRPRPRLSLAP